jgi:hypothetical protein
MSVTGSRVILAIVVAVLTWTNELRGGARGLDRAAVLAGLERRALTGMPRHLDHDDGEELQAAVTAALTASPNDAEMAWAAIRGSFSIVPHVGPAISDSMPSIGLEVLAPLSLPWKIATVGTVELSLDGAAWRAIDLPPAGHTGVPVEKLFPRAARPGFHLVRLRASLRHRGQPGSLPTDESRELPALTYGVTGISAGGQRVAAFLASGTRATVADFDATLPRVAIDTWLRSATSTSDSPRVSWSGQWCEERPGAGEQPRASVCARGIFGLAQAGGHGEVWVKVAAVDASGDRPTWTALTPSLEGIDLITRQGRSTVTLASLPSALRSAEADWPRAELVLDTTAINLSPGSPRSGEPVTIRTELRNSGTADLYGLTIDVLAFDSPGDGPMVRRRFVRSIPAGDSVAIETPAVFPRGYGGVMVSVMTLTEHSVFPPLMTYSSDGFLAYAVRVIRPDLAPPGFADRVRSSIGCQPGCANIR